jgi:four helix bundle protein
MVSTHRFRELKIWQKAILIAQHTYQLCAKFPIDERYGLTSQMRRAAVSIASNIAEGAGRALIRILATSFLSQLAQAMNWKRNLCWLPDLAT